MIQTLINFEYELTIYDCIDKGIPLIGNYAIVEMYIGRYRRAILITEEWLNRDDRLFDPHFNIRHQLMIGINGKNDNTYH